MADVGGKGAGDGTRAVRSGEIGNAIKKRTPLPREYQLGECLALGEVVEIVRTSGAKLEVTIGSTAPAGHAVPRRSFDDFGGTVLFHPGAAIE